MEKICENCGQLINDSDKFCRYCGYNIPQKVVVEKLNKRDIEDRISLEKATVTTEDIVKSDKIDVSKINVILKGDLHELKSKNTMGFIVLSVIFAISAVFLLLIRFGLLKSYTLIANILMIICLIVTIITGVSIFEKMSISKTYDILSRVKITIKRIGWNKNPYILIDNLVFELELDIDCATCNQEIIGKMHIEQIDGSYFAVCNYNRKHILSIDKEDLFNIDYTQYIKIKLR